MLAALTDSIANYTRQSGKNIEILMAEIRDLRIERAGLEAEIARLRRELENARRAA